jgi:pimeloyl-ACP methyl ester carboxylesterase
VLAGYEGIDSQSKLRRRAVAALLLAALIALLTLPAAASATQGGVVGGGKGGKSKAQERKEEEEKLLNDPKPQLLLFHGGSFLFEDPLFRPSIKEFAEASGFEPHFVTYPLDDMPAAVLTARAEARKLRDKVGAEHVFAYGTSAGGTLAALLAGEGLVSAAVAKAPVSDLVSWEWPLGAYGPQYFESVDLSLNARYRLSPLRRPAESPLLIYQGRGDKVVPPSMNEAYAAKFERVYLWKVPGGHTTERLRPYLIQESLSWLRKTALLQARAAAPKDALP